MHICTYAHMHIRTSKNTMLDKLMQAQQKAGEVKQRLDAITVTGTAEGGKITVLANANKVIQSVSIADDFFKEADREQLEELLVIAINKTMEQADNISQSEMAAMTKEMLGGLGGLF
jgi:nucleoid-associated protein EbfC